MSIFFVAEDDSATAVWRNQASSRWSPEMLDFLRTTLNTDQTKRPTAIQLLEHPFLVQTEPVIKELQKKLELVFIGNSLRMNGLL